MKNRKPLRVQWAEYRNSSQPRKDVTSACGFLLVVLLLNATVVGNVYVPTGSMKDTIREYERFLVWKAGYGVQNPISPREKLTAVGQALLKWKDADRGDIVVFVPPERTGNDQNYVKRLIGLPGETVEVRPRVGVFVDGQLLDEPYLMESPQYWMPPVVVPDGQAFVLGDNRNNSNDSHVWGFLDQQSIQGVMAFRYWPLGRFGFLGPDARRNNRILLTVALCLAAAWIGWHCLKRPDCPTEVDGNA